MKCFSLGIIGNFSGHLAGAEKVAENSLPNGVFVVNGLNERVVSTGDDLTFPPHGTNIQAEPEFVVKFNIKYADNKVSRFIPVAMTVGNDMTIRKLEGAQKIAERKVWGEASKGLAAHWWPVNELEVFTEEYKLISIVKRDDEYQDYTPVADPSELKVFYTEMCDWLTNTVNTQQSEGILREILPQIAAAGYPEEIVVFCGAPNYTCWGETHFIEKNDEISIALINSKKVSVNFIKDKIKSNALINDDCAIVYKQKIV